MQPSPINQAAIRAFIAQASARSGVDFGFLLQTAQAESGLNPAARAKTSSATGLFQFVESTWLDVVRRHGDEAGVGWAAKAAALGGRRLDPAMRAAVLALRDSPEVSARLAASHTADNGKILGNVLGRTAAPVDLYLAHFLGAGGAVTFLRGLAADPDQEGARLFPAAASANPGVFGSRSLADIYQRFAGKFEDSDAVSPIPSGGVVPGVSAAARLAYLTLAALGG